jgi:uncharacterized protein
MTALLSPRRLLAPKRLVPFAIVGAVLFALASPAFAHVEISSDDAKAGQVSTMTLSVPNEMKDAGTDSLDLRFPERQTLTDVTVMPTEGWNAVVSADRIVWSGGPLTGEEEVEFTFTAKLPPDVETLEFKALQHYTNDQTVSWIEETPPGGEEPDHPAPVLTIGGSTEDHHAESNTDATSTDDDHSEAANASSTKSDDDSNTGVIVAVVVVVVVILAGGGTLLYLRSRRATP